MDFQFNRMEGKRNSRKEYFDPTGVRPGSALRGPRSQRQQARSLPPRVGAPSARDRGAPTLCDRPRNSYLCHPMTTWSPEPQQSAPAKSSWLAKDKAGFFCRAFLEPWPLAVAARGLDAHRSPKPEVRSRRPRWRLSCKEPPCRGFARSSAVRDAGPEDLVQRRSFEPPKEDDP